MGGFISYTTYHYNHVGSSWEALSHAPHVFILSLIINTFGDFIDI